MKVLDIIVLVLFAIPSAGHLMVYFKKSEEKPTKATVWGIVILTCVSIIFAAWLISATRFY